ncbi:hypothetical protein BY996DRAFT_6444149 [Phakopsora pachyrhizi]|nr:hypothetical protein BY996DRAFT_6444149 [Phakopsora pachyrhizi]
MSRLQTHSIDLQTCPSKKEEELDRIETMRPFNLPTIASLQLHNMIDFKFPKINDILLISLLTSYCVSLGRKTTAAQKDLKLRAMTKICYAQRSVYMVIKKQPGNKGSLTPSKDKSESTKFRANN